jgi:hypothetical protein
MLPPLDCILLPVVFSVEQKDCGRTNINGSVRQDCPFIAEAISQMQRLPSFIAWGVRKIATGPMQSH